MLWSRAWRGFPEGGQRAKGSDRYTCESLASVWVREPSKGFENVCAGIRTVLQCKGTLKQSVPAHQAAVCVLHRRHHAAPRRQSVHTLLYVLRHAAAPGLSTMTGKGSAPGGGQGSVVCHRQVRESACRGEESGEGLV